MKIEYEEFSYPEKYDLPPTKSIKDFSGMNNYEISFALSKTYAAYRESLTEPQLKRYRRMQNDEHVRSLMPLNKDDFDFEVWREYTIEALQAYEP
jgi:hypothetical protein